MKILFTGGGTGGHFYPIIAVADAVYELAEEERLLAPELIFMSDSKYDEEIISREGLIYKKIYAGKIRRYFSLLNITDVFKTGLGIIKAIWSVYSNMPDVIFGKGGYATFPVLLAARIFKIPVIIHESDSVPGAVNKWAGKFAQRIAISFPETAKYFPKEKTALTGLPIRKTVSGSMPEEGREVFNLTQNLPTLLILGGSQGSQKINDVILQLLEELLKNYQVIHQCGRDNEQEIKGRSDIILQKSLLKDRYHLYPFLDEQLMRQASGAADLVVSRGGASAIYEIANWGLPSIIIPLKNSAQDHQRANAYNYSRAGASEVVEEDNLSPHVLLSEINKIISDKKRKEAMAASAKRFSKPEAARKIALEIIKMALQHAG